MSHKLNSARTAVVSLDAAWIPIDEHTPRGVKLMLISRAAGVAQIGLHQRTDTHYTHWHPLPKFFKDTIKEAV